MSKKTNHPKPKNSPPKPGRIDENKGRTIPKPAKPKPNKQHGETKENIKT